MFILSAMSHCLDMNLPDGYYFLLHGHFENDMKTKTFTYPSGRKVNLGQIRLFVASELNISTDNIKFTNDVKQAIKNFRK